ncbi:hypothetical protein C1H46_043466 [Malus baccata]|uniref:GDSL esterase/lipase n=1 Tax=Malus baccata TaxID=106549 RepID=A0A540K9T9_MALBA|nr:hypothetical protein C1H46_043466 [Malus baccata]
MSRIGIPAAQKLLRRAIYGIAIGSNDIMFFEISITEMTLYNLNARKFIVGNAGPGGCIPWEKDLHFLPGGTCARVVNKMARMYNKLKRLLVELNKDLKGANFVYADIYQILTDLTENYVSYGFENGISACCSTAGPRGGLILCNPLAKVCPDRSKYVFWDPFHLTEAGNLIAARHIMDGDLTYMSPMNLRQLMQS